MKIDFPVAIVSKLPDDILKNSNKIKPNIEKTKVSLNLKRSCLTIMTFVAGDF